VAGPASASPPSLSARSTEDPAALLTGDRLALTVTEAAELLGISRALAYELVARNELPSIRLGRRLVVPKVALLEMLGLRPKSS
jgi:excisionase family DNA binding protein